VAAACYADGGGKVCPSTVAAASYADGGGKSRAHLARNATAGEKMLTCEVARLLGTPQIRQLGQ